MKVENNRCRVRELPGRDDEKEGRLRCEKDERETCLYLFLWNLW